MNIWKRLLLVVACLYTLVATGLGSIAFAQVTLNLPPGSTTPVVSTAADQSLPSFLQIQFTGLPAGYDVTNQTYAGWCAAANEALIVSETSAGSPIWSENSAVYGMVNTYPPSGAGSTLPPGDQSPAWPMVSWLLNHQQGASGTVGATVVDIQEAIWFLLQGEYFADPPFTGSFDPNNPTAAAVQLASDAQADGADFLPEPGQVVAVLLAGISQPGNPGPPQNLVFALKPAVIPWEMFHHDLSHTGLSPADTGANKGKQKWAFPTGDTVYSCPAVGPDGTIYIGSHDKYLYAINPDRTKKWDFKTEELINSSPAVGPDGMIYVGSGKNLYAVTPDGKQKWKFATGRFISYSSPAVGTDNTVYIGSTDGKLYAVKDGMQKWKFTIGDFMSAIDSSPAVGGSEGNIYVGSFDHYLYAVTPEGKQKWRFETKGIIRSSPALDAEGNIYVGSLDKSVYAIRPDGTQKWEFKTEGGVNSSPAVGADTVYVGSNDKTLYAINFDGTEKWKFATTGLILSSPALGADGTIYVGSEDGRLYAVTSEGKEKWSLEIGSGELRNMYGQSSPAIGGTAGTIYIGGGTTKNVIAVQ